MREKKRELRIAMLGQKRVPSREGGIEVVVEELTTRMVKMGHEVTCYNRKGHHVSSKEFDKEEIEEYKGVKIKIVPTIQGRGLAAMSSSTFAAIRCAFGKYDIVHFHAEGPCAMIWLPKLFGKKCIATIHGLDYKRAKWGKIASAYIKFGERCAAKYADEIVVLSEGVRKYFEETYNRETVFIPNGVSRPTIREPKFITEKWGLEKDGYILYLGRVVPEKGLKYLISAYKRIITDRKLVIAGGKSDTGSYMMELKRLAKDDDRIIFTGFVEGQELEELYSNAYVYTLPSDLEGMPLSLLEAMSYGNCCLTSDIPECVDVTEDKAVNFYQGDVDDLAQTLSYLCSNPQIVNRYKRNAANYICKKYNWDDVTYQTIQLYREALGESKTILEKNIAKYRVNNDIRIDTMESGNKAI